MLGLDATLCWEKNILLCMLCFFSTYDARFMGQPVNSPKQKQTDIRTFSNSAQYFFIRQKCRRLPFASVLFRPSCPTLLAPQQNTWAGRASASVWAPPAEIWVTGTPTRDRIRAGSACSSTDLPSPSCPYLFWPHEKTSPPLRCTGLFHQYVLLLL